MVVDRIAVGRLLQRGFKLAWASPYTVLGLTLGLLAMFRGGRIQRVDGVWEIEGPLIGWMLDRLPLQHVAAMTLGHTVLGRSSFWLEQTRLHERVHVRQYEQWGPLFPCAYLAASAWLLCQGRDCYRENPFEREAYRIAP
jgi:hypothetical protein